MDRKSKGEHWTPGDLHAVNPSGSPQEEIERLANQENEDFDLLTPEEMDDLMQSLETLLPDDWSSINADNAKEWPDAIELGDDDVYDSRMSIYRDAPKEFADLASKTPSFDKLTPQEEWASLSRDEKTVWSASAVITALITIVGLMDALNAKEMDYGSNGTTQQEVMLQLPRS